MSGHPLKKPPGPGASHWNCGAIRPSGRAAEDSDAAASL